MAIDWERVIVESDDNGVVVSAGQVSLLIGADADSVNWGNITGDITQQPDLMHIIDGYVSADSPTLTGIPRSVTPPEGNDSTRIATTAFVQGEINPPNNSYIYGRSNGEWVALTKFASEDYIDYSSDVINKPVLGSIASKDTVNYETDVTNKPTLGSIASKDTVNYETDVTNKPEPPGNSGDDEKVYGRTSYAGTHGWRKISAIATINDPPQDPTSTDIQYWVVTHRYYQDSKKWAVHWDKLPVPDSASLTPENFARTAWFDENLREYKNGWQKLGAMSLVNEPPAGGGNIPMDYYCRTVRQSGVNLRYEWTELPLPDISSNPKSDAEIYVMASYMVGTPPNHSFLRKWVKLGTASSLNIDTSGL